jgi:hypothetical protein
MTRTSLLFWPSAVALGFAVAALLVVADEKPAEKGELIDTFLQSLKAGDPPPSEDSDRCPGETAADRSDDEMAPVTTPDEVEIAPSDDAAEEN